ncbi:DUF423 domain-containing protein [Ferrimonas gelatinilytica]|uniref:DUF423 domain-containing protein n=1 Tax=Ferrimonas gelatinilytica TaxID=1255257 RepID=A0ABP9RU90_9GAMM
MARLFGIIAALSGLLATALGAYGAHGLPGKVSPALLASFETAVQYQFFHSLLLLLLALALRLRHCPFLVAAGGCLVLGMLGFSGSIYALVLLGDKFFGPITPMGGLMLMIGWLLLAVAAVKWEKIDE